MALVNTGTMIEPGPAPLEVGQRVVLAAFQVAIESELNYDLGFADGSLSIPVLTDITPDPFEQPGDDGAFSIDFRTSRLTPISFRVSNLSAEAQLAIMVSFDNRNENMVARDFDGVWHWPFDVEADNFTEDLDVEPVFVQLLPRGGWPPSVVRFQVANARASE